MQNLETINRQKFKNCLEFRPYPQAYHLNNKINEGFEVDNTYFFGIRVKNFYNPEINGHIKDVHPQIDLTETRSKFFNKIYEFLSNEEKPDFSYDENRKQGEIDIDIKCLSRDELPEQVRPKNKQVEVKSIPA